MRGSDGHASSAPQLTLFAGGGPQDQKWAPHLTVIPIPLLSQVRACSHSMQTPLH